MNKKLFAIILSALLIASATGCSKNDNTPPLSSDNEVTSTVESVSEPPVNSDLTSDPEVSSSVGDADQRLDGLTLNEYDGLTMTSEVLQRMLILPGHNIPVHVTIKNEGDKTIIYTQGSGVFTTPQALFATVDGLQTVMPQDHLGPATMDYVTRELEPGDELTYVVNIMAIEPNENFDAYTYDMYNQDKQYIAETDPITLREALTDLIPANAGTYSGNVYFTYFVKDENAEATANVTGNPTGYIESEFSITINEDGDIEATSNVDDKSPKVSANEDGVINAASNVDDKAPEVSAE